MLQTFFVMNKDRLITITINSHSVLVSIVGLEVGRKSHPFEDFL